MEIGRWNRHRFVVSSEVIRSFNALSITGSSETEDKDAGKEKYVSFKNAKPTDVSLNVHLSSQLGCDVRDEASGMVDDAKRGIADYFYIGQEKLVTCQLMLTEASVSEIGIAYDGSWTQADVKMTFKQCSKDDGSIANSGGGAGGKKKSLKDLLGGVTKAQEKEQPISANYDVYPVMETVTSYYYATDEERAAQQAVASANNIINKAKRATTELTTTTTAKSNLVNTIGGKVVKVNKR